MDRENTSLFLQNLLLMQENERMRREAQQLDHENKALLAQLKHRSYQQQQQHQGSGGPSGSGSASSGGGGHSASAAAAANNKVKAAGKQQHK